MTSLTREIWGRDLDLEVHFEDLDDEGIDDAQWDAYGRIVCAWDVLNESLRALKEYCIEQSPDEFSGEALDNVFRFAIPKNLFIPRVDEQRVVALMCDYRFDPEHGIAIVFVNEALAEIGPQDIVL